ncbi:carboxy terminal-processing peptidase [Echinimonas agarilytica]|uniref:Carboxy terminal-processing peptidase n=1 Tax=Echinimonas agarilytica TaxID=1215918 RepID=A0AA41W8S8_9GAMM|nr:carboxy terminal-processing peptidase [Echinimonas agarilytica]MCM2681154.1 carboxy terminal-processing peptidase [Echinimonas agarilytica]
MRTLVKLIAGISLTPLLLLASEQAAPVVYTEADIPKLAQEPQHRNAAIRVTDVFTQSHYHPIQLNDDFSVKIFERYLDSLDYNRQIFIQSDIDGFRKYEKNFDDYLKSGRLSVPYEIYQLSLKRRFERFQKALVQVEKGFDFTADESIEYDRHELPWPKTPAELDEIWRKQVKADALNLVLSGKDVEEAQEMLTKRYTYAIKRLTQSNSEDVFQLVMNSFARSIEPHTSYLSPRNAERFKQDINLSLEGIGAVLQSDYDYTVIRRLVAGGPAASSNQLKPDDKITGVGQDKDDIVNIVGWRLDEVVELIKGPKGTKVFLEIVPVKGGVDGEAKIVTIVRDKIRLEDQAAKTEVKKAEEGLYAGREVAVLDIPSFYNGLTEDVRKQLEEVVLDKVEAVIVDLRGNGGGSLPEAISLTGLFIDRGPVVQRRNMIGEVTVDSDRDPRTQYTGPVVIMVDRYSASASEIFAAALQDYGRALVIGEQTFGKGTVQNHRSLNRRFDLFKNPLGDIQFTTAKFYRINGGSTQNKGVIPDILFPQETDPSEYGESQEDNALPWDQIRTANYVKRKDIRGKVPALDASHKQRIKSDPEFVYVFEDIKRYKAEKEDKSVSLNEAQRIKKREERKARALARENERRERKGLEAVTDIDELEDDDSAKPEDLYLDEAIAITFDLVDGPAIVQN